MSSVLDYLFGGSPPASFNSTSSSSTTYPQWLTDATTALISKASQAAGTPYQAYTGPRVAGFVPDQTQAFDMTQANVGNYQPAYNQAGTNFGTVSQGFNPAAFSQFMNPYTSNVVDTIQQLGDRNLVNNVLPQVNSTFTSAGQFGSSRNADFTQRAIQDNQQAISNAQGQALSTGFQNSMSDYQNQLAQQLAAGNADLNLGTAQQGAGLKDTAAVAAVGQQQQGQNQTNLNTAYQDFLNQQNYPYQQANFMSNIIRGLPTNTTTTGSQTVPTQGQPGLVSQLGGLAIGGVGLANALGAFGGSGAAAAGTGGNFISDIPGIGSTNIGLFGYAGGGPVGYTDGKDIGPDLPFRPSRTLKRFAFGGTFMPSHRIRTAPTAPTAGRRMNTGPGPVPFRMPTAAPMGGVAGPRQAVPRLTSSPSTALAQIAGLGGGSRSPRTRGIGAPAGVPVFGSG